MASSNDPRPFLLGQSMSIMAFAQQASARVNPGVSVVIPAYNYARYLGAALDSVLSQDYPPIEIVVVDDGSTDNTREVVAAYGERVRYLFQENAGLPAARNAGIKAAQYPFIAFLDADDMWLPGMLRRIMETYAQLSEEFGLIAGKRILTDQEGKVIESKRKEVSPGGEVTVRDLIFRSRFSPSSVVTRRAVFENCGYFDTELRSTEDRDMWIRIAARWRVHLIGEPLIYVRTHANNMSKNADRMKRNMQTVMAKTRRNEIVSRWNVLFWLRVQSYLHYQTSLLLNYEGRVAEAVKDLILSVALWPFFLTPTRFNEPTLFRLRRLAHYFLDGAEKRETGRV